MKRLSINWVIGKQQFRSLMGVTRDQFLIIARKLRLHWIRGVVDGMLADISRIKSALDWMPSVPFEKGLKEIKDRVKAGSENSFSSGIDDILLGAAA